MVTAGGAIVERPELDLISGVAAIGEEVALVVDALILYKVPWIRALLSLGKR